MNQVSLAAPHVRWSSRLRSWSVARPWQTNLALAILGLLLFLLSRHLVSEYDSYTIGFSGTSGWSVWCYLFACFVVLTQPTDRLTFPLILVIAVLCRMATLFAPPHLSSDIYRYVWDGMVQHARINPYRYVPADPALAFLRDASNGDIYPAINRATYAHTIYPPFAQMIYLATTVISPTVTCMKTVMVLFEGVTLWAVLKLLAHLGRPREQALLYAWCPLLVWEIAGAGHVDSAVIAMTMLAVLFRYQRRRVLTGIFLALAVLTKFYPLVLFPALYLRLPAPDLAGQSRLRQFVRTLDWQMPAAMVAVIVPLYAIYSSVGWNVFGFLGGYAQEEGMESGGRYFLLDALHKVPHLAGVPAWSFLLFSGLAFTWLTVWAILRSSPVELAPRSTRASLADQLRPHHAAAFLPPAFALGLALMLLFSPHYPWYVAWLIPFVTLLPNLPVMAYILGLFYLCTTSLAQGYGPRQFQLNVYLYSGVGVAVVLGLLLRRWPAWTTTLFGPRHLAPGTELPDA